MFSYNRKARSRRVLSHDCMVNEEEQRENFHQTVLMHSKNEPGNYPGGHSVEVHDFPSLQKDFHQQRIHNMSNEVLNVKTPPGWHRIGDVKSVSSPNYCEHDRFLTNPSLTLSGTSSRATLHFLQY
jgi:hypothetical protein